MTQDSLNLLVKTLRERDIPYDREALKAAFANPESQTAIEAWVQDCLSPETLLTKDEAALYATLAKTGEAETLAAQDLSLVQGLDDQEIQHAIEELKRSTAAIEKQSEALRLQQNAMSALIHSRKRSNQARAHTDEGQVRKWEVEKSQICAAIEEVSSSLTYQILDAEQGLKISEANVKSTVDSIFKSDDKLLLSLQKLASDLDPVQSGDDSMIARIRDLCARLIKHTVEGIRTRLDHVYLAASNGAPNLSDENGGETQEIKELQEELESLYSEILPVAQMSTEQQYLEPALRILAASEGQGQERSVKAVAYINDCLVFLVNRIETFLARAEEVQCHKMALQFVIDSAKQELSQPAVTPVPPNATPAKSGILKRRKSPVNQNLGRTRNTRRSSGNFDLDIEPEQELGRSLGITLPSEEASEQTTVEIMDKMLSERTARLEDHAASLQTATEALTSTHLSDAQSTLNLLHGSLLADSLFHKICLLNPDIQSSVTALEQDIYDLQGALESVDLRSLQSRNVHREQILERWLR